MGDRDHTNGDAADIIEDEGLDYAVRHYISGDEFNDPTTEKLWTEADKALTALVQHLERETGRDIG